jgi:hypothetical protein
VETKSTEGLTLGSADTTGKEATTGTHSSKAGKEGVACGALASALSKVPAPPAKTAKQADTDPAPTSASPSAPSVPAAPAASKHTPTEARKLNKQMVCHSDMVVSAAVHASPQLFLELLHKCIV